MKNKRNRSRIHIAVRALVERQLSDWQQLLVELETEPLASRDSLAYCRTQIEQLKSKANHLTLLNNGSSN